jgi:hypothetical protein
MLLDTSLLDPAEDGPAPAGSLSVLNCGAGDLKFRFDKDDPEEVVRAKKVIEDMLKRGYTLLVEVDGELRRASGFDPAKGCYVVTEPPPPDAPAPSATAAASEADERFSRKRKGRRREVPMTTTRATGIAPTAGG